MVDYIYFLNSLGIILAIGHFYFAYKNYIKRFGSRKAILLFFTAIAISSIFFFGIGSIRALPQLSFFTFVIFTFALHHSYDMFKFNYKKSAIFWLLYGSFSSYLFLFGRDIFHSSFTYTMIWGMVFFHYFYWIYLSTQNFLSKSFLLEIILCHILLIMLFVFNELYLDSAYLKTFFSLPVFYFMTLVHVVFSLLKDIVYIKSN